MSDVSEIAWSVSGCLKREGGTKGQWGEEVKKKTFWGAKQYSNISQIVNKKGIRVKCLMAKACCDEKDDDDDDDDNDVNDDDDGDDDDE